MKPDWKDAPEWARYLAMDDDGAWVWYEEKPVIGQTLWFDTNGRYSYANRLCVYWKDSLEQRPETSERSTDKCESERSERSGGAT